MKKNTKKIILFIVALSTFSLMSLKNVSAISSVTVGGETLAEGGSTINIAGTAVYNIGTNTLTLNNYNGGAIVGYTDEDLTIVLEGDNIVSTTTDDYGVLSNYTGLNISGDGTLLVQGGNSAGVGSNNGSLNIEDVSITIKNSSYGMSSIHDINMTNADITILDSGSMFVFIGDNFTMNGGSLSMSNPTTSTTLNNGFQAASGTAIIRGGNITVGNAVRGFMVKNFIIEKGTVTTNNTVGMGAVVDDSAIINGGSLVLNAQIVGLLSENIIEINEGHIEVNAGSENAGVAMAVMKMAPSADFVMADGMRLTPDNFSLQTGILDYEGTPMNVITIGTTGISASLTGLSITTSNVANSLTIYSVYTYEFLEGNNQNFIESMIDNYRFKIDSNYVLVNSLKIGELTLEKDTDYLVTDDGGTVVNLTNAGKSKLNILSGGTYDVLVGYVNGRTAQGKIVISPKYAYTFLEGNGQSFVKATINNYGLKIDGNYAAFDSLSISGLTLEKGTDYLVTDDGGTVINFTNTGVDKLNTLSIGEYDVVVNYVNGKVVQGVVAIRDYTYTFLEGNNQSFVESMVDHYEFRVDGNYALFDSLTIGELSLEKDIDYLVTEGSTIINFTDAGIAKLNTLSIGEYDVVVNYSNRKFAQSKIIITLTPPNTYDGIITWMLLGVASLGVMISGVVVFRFRK